jgi:hypothetical protein
MALAIGEPAVRGETLTILRRTTVLERPREPSAAVVVVESGRTAKVLSARGDWVKVRVAGQIGWVRRSWVERRDNTNEERALEEEAVPEVDEAQAAEEDDPLADDGDDDSGDDEDDDDGSGDDDAEAEVSRDDDAALRGPHGRVAASATLGLRNLSARQRSDGAMELANYDTDARAYAIAVGVDVAVARWDAVFVWAAARYQGSVASPGIRYALSEEIDGTVPFTTHEIDAGARAGYLFGPVLASGRLGYHVDLFTVARLENVGLMPSEMLTGVTIGAAVELPFTGDGWTARASVDRLVSGKRGQTRGLSDGAPQAADATWAGIMIGYALSGHYAAEISYSQATASTRFTGQSARQPDVTRADRSDVSKQISLGVRHSF